MRLNRQLFPGDELEHDTLGARIKARRRSLEISQGDLGGLVGGMSQAWVSRVEKDLLKPDRDQLDALELVLGPLTRDPQSTGEAGVMPAVGSPATYKATRLVAENTRRRAELGLRMERLQKREEASNELLASERQLAIDFTQQFVRRAVELPSSSLENLKSLDISAFDVVDDDSSELIEVRNGVVRQLEIQIQAAAPTSKSASALRDGASALVAVTALEAFASATTGAAVRRVSLSGISAATGMRRAPVAAGGVGTALGLGAGITIGASALPALIAAGVIVTVAGRRHLKRVQDERSQLLEAAIELDRLQVAVGEYCTQAETTARLLAHARELGTAELARLQSDGAGGADANLETLVKVVALILTLLPLPIPDGPSDVAPLGATHRANELALDSAEAWLAEAGALE